MPFSIPAFPGEMNPLDQVTIQKREPDMDR